MPGGFDWGLVAVTTDLSNESRELAQLAWEFRREARSWSHPGGRGELERIARELVDHSQLAALETSRGDYWTRRDALRRAVAMRSAARLSLRLWWERGELWNSHRLRPVPATIARGLT